MGSCTVTADRDADSDWPNGLPRSAGAVASACETASSAGPLGPQAPRLGRRFTAEAWIDGTAPCAAPAAVPTPVRALARERVGGSSRRGGRAAGRDRKTDGQRDSRRTPTLVKPDEGEPLIAVRGLRAGAHVPMLAACAAARTRSAAIRSTAHIRASSQSPRHHATRSSAHAHSPCNPTTWHCSLATP